MRTWLLSATIKWFGPTAPWVSGLNALPSSPNAGKLAVNCGVGRPDVSGEPADSVLLAVVAVLLLGATAAADFFLALSGTGRFGRGVNGRFGLGLAGMVRPDCFSSLASSVKFPVLRLVATPAWPFLVSSAPRRGLP